MKIGILGGGQLGRMLGQAAIPLGIEVFYYSDANETCIGQLGPLTKASLSDLKSLKAFCKKIDVLTFESENIPVELITELESLVTVAPSSAALRIGQDRWLEKKFFKSLDIPTAQTLEISTNFDFENFSHQKNFPSILKTRRDGYDGKNQIKINSNHELLPAWKKLESLPCVLEKVVSFDKEVSAIVVNNSSSGELLHYPLIENKHQDGILRTSLIPADVDPAISELALQYCSKVVNELRYTGVLTIEFFLKDNELIANEMAPRVHNSGHLTVEACVVSQFENHLRAIAGLPLGSTFQIAKVEMQNLISTTQPLQNYLVDDKFCKVHFYGKSERENRKLGHISKYIFS